MYKQKQQKFRAALAPFYELMDDLAERGELGQSNRPKPAPPNNGTYDKRGAPYVCYVCSFTYFDKEILMHTCLKRTKEIQVCDRCMEKLVADKMARIELRITIPQKKKAG